MIYSKFYEQSLEILASYIRKENNDEEEKEIPNTANFSALRMDIPNVTCKPSK
jgi:hypothetical protein